MRMLILFLLFLPLTAIADGVPSGPYTPLQPAHWGNWYDPDHAGEGIELSLVETADGKVIFANIYLLRDGAATWHSAIADWSEARDPLARDYEIPTYQRPAPGGDPVPTGTIWLRPEGSQLRAQFAIGGQLWQRTLYQLTRPPVGNIGVCDWNGFFPRPPAAPVGWCHD
jgi:hypothetical protein